MRAPSEDCHSAEQLTSPSRANKKWLRLKLRTGASAPQNLRCPHCRLRRGSTHEPLLARVVSQAASRHCPRRFRLGALPFAGLASVIALPATDDGALHVGVAFLQDKMMPPWGPCSPSEWLWPWPCLSLPLGTSYPKNGVEETCRFKPSGGPRPGQY